jgi:bacterioferritin
MKGNAKVLDALNTILADELTAINQYMVQAEVADNWGYEKFHGDTEGRACAEMKHAAALISRIVFLEGTPVVSKLNPIHVGEDIPAFLKNDRVAEKTAIDGYNKGIALAVEVGDNGTRDLLEEHLEQEEEHINYIEAQLDQIGQMGLQNYLSGQV